MSQEEEIRFHLERERQCREMARRAEQTNIKKIHLELAELHRQAAQVSISEAA